MWFIEPRRSLAQNAFSPSLRLLSDFLRLNRNDQNLFTLAGDAVTVVLVVVVGDGPAVTVPLRCAN